MDSYIEQGIEIDGLPTQRFYDSDLVQTPQLAMGYLTHDELQCSQVLYCISNLCLGVAVLCESSEHGFPKQGLHI